MLKNNVAQKGFVNYFNIQWNEREQVWYAWFFVTEDNISELERLSGGDE
jgi:hypothetical protein